MPVDELDRGLAFVADADRVNEEETVFARIG